MRLFALVFFVVAFAEDLLEREISQLETLIHLQQQKLNRLRDLRDVLMTEERQIPDLNEEKLKSLILSPSRPKPKAKQTSTLATRSFINRVLKKFSVKTDSHIREAQIISTFQYRSALDTQSSQMLLAVTKNNEIQLFDMTGQHLDTTQSQQSYIEFVATSSRSDDPVVATYSDGTVHIYKIESKRLNKTEDSNSNELPQTKFNSRIKIESKIESIFSLEEDMTAAITDFEYITFKGNRYLLFSDASGSISVYHRNGTYVGKKSVSQHPILSIHRSYPNVLFATKQSIGYFNPVSLEVSAPFCEGVPYDILQVTMDVQQNNIVYVLTESREIYIYEIRSNEGVCKIRLRIAAEQDVTPRHQLVSLRYFLMLFDPATKQALVYNTSEVLSDDPGFIDDPLRVNFLGSAESTIDVVAMKGLGTSHYLLVNEKLNNETTSELSYYEVIIPARKDTDLFSNLRVPILIIVAVLAFGYQFYVRGDKKVKKDRMPDERELEALLGKKPFKGGDPFKDKGSTGGSADRGLAGMAGMAGLNIPGDKLGPGIDRPSEKPMERQQASGLPSKARMDQFVEQLDRPKQQNSVRTIGLEGRQNPKKLN